MTKQELLNEIEFIGNQLSSVKEYIFINGMTNYDQQLLNKYNNQLTELNQQLNN